LKAALEAGGRRIPRGSTRARCGGALRVELC
jgi:hypothetical protein